MLIINTLFIIINVRTPNILYYPFILFSNVNNNTENQICAVIIGPNLAGVFLGATEICLINKYQLHPLFVEEGQSCYARGK